MGYSNADSLNANSNVEQDVAALYHSLIDAWNRRSAAEYAALFSDNATIVGFDGSTHAGRSGMERDLAAIFADHPTPPYVTKVRAVSALGPGVALLTAIAGMIPPGKDDLEPSLNAVQSLVAVKAGDTWRIELFQNTPAAFHGRPELVAQMTDELRGHLPGMQQN